MTKEDIKRAFDEYKEIYENEYGWKLYRFSKKGGTQRAYVKYENPNYPYKFIISVSGYYYMTASQLCGGNCKIVDRYDGDAFAVLCLALWMRDQVEDSTMYKIDKRDRKENKK